jgi:hypothetical protein
VRNAEAIRAERLKSGAISVRRRGLLASIVLPMFCGGCVMPTAHPAVPVLSPAGSIMADAAYPPIGAKWRVRVTKSSAFHTNVTDNDITAINVVLSGRPAYGMAGPETTRVLDPVTFNPIGLIRNGKVVFVDNPGKALFSWPLRVGETWEAMCGRTDLEYGEMFLPSKSRTRVVAVEDVTVPAGTFQAFRIDYHGGIGTSTFGGPRSTTSGAGIESRGIFWYAPGPKLIVRSDVVRMASYYRWSGRTIQELLTTPTMVITR